MTVNWDGDRVVAEIDGDAGRALKAGLEYLGDEADRKCPIETGALIRSRQTAVSGLEGATGYGTPYAVKQHEEVGYQHDSGREAKWLENALNNRRDQILQAIADELRKSL